jgi:hypothetical protein
MDFDAVDDSRPAWNECRLDAIDKIALEGGIGGDG